MYNEKTKEATKKNNNFALDTPYMCQINQPLFNNTTHVSKCLFLMVCCSYVALCGWCVLCTYSVPFRRSLMFMFILMFMLNIVCFVLFIFIRVQMWDKFDGNLYYHTQNVNVSNVRPVKKVRLRGKFVSFHMLIDSVNCETLKCVACCISAIYTAKFAR